MKLLKIFCVVLLLFLSSQICLGQEITEDENWIGVIEFGEAPFLRHVFNKYTLEDAEKAKKKLYSIRQSKNKDEWEGSYDLFGELSDTKLILNSESGFVSYNIYTCSIELRSLNYGRIINNSDSISLISEKPQPPYFGMGETNQIKLVKVKWGDIHYLIEENELDTFCEMAAGHYETKTQKATVDGRTFEYQSTIWNSYWVMSGLDKKAFGLPVLPEAYKNHLKQPIETKIISVGKMVKEIGETEYASSSSTTRVITIMGGKDKGIKKDMSFYIPQSQERITIEKVGKKSSTAYLSRDYDTETQSEECRRNGQQIPCVNPSVGMAVQTISDMVLD